jgi:hypothetical protein
MKSARQQSKDLKDAQEYINVMLSTDPKKEPTKASPVNPSRTSPIKDFNLKARFSDPPAPPPQQPLPEKPDAASSLRRSDTERPKTGSPIRSDVQTSTLTEALSSAKKELESQSIRLRDLEAMLNEERRAREDAEERANRLERESIRESEEQEDQHTNGTIRGGGSDGIEEEEKATGLENGSTSPGAADTTARLQQRLELMVTEMNEMKQQMERYRERAETAEADRTSLAEMIENIRRDNAKSANKTIRRRSLSGSRLASDVTSAGHEGTEDDNNAEEGEITIIRDQGLDEDGIEETIQRASATNGHAVKHEGNTTVKSSNALVARRNERPDYMHYGGPVSAMVTVVAIGVAVMAMLNQYPKTER